MYLNTRKYSEVLRPLRKVNLLMFSSVLFQELSLDESCSHLFTIWICSRNLRKFTIIFFRFCRVHVQDFLADLNGV